MISSSCTHRITVRSIIPVLLVAVILAGLWACSSSKDSRKFNPYVAARKQGLLIIDINVVP